MTTAPQSDMSPEMQLAAVEAAIAGGMTLKEVTEQFPTLGEGIRLYKEKSTPPRVAKGSSQPVFLSPRPQITI